MYGLCRGKGPIRDKEPQVSNQSTAPYRDAPKPPEYLVIGINRPDRMTVAINKAAADGFEPLMALPGSYSSDLLMVRR